MKTSILFCAVLLTLQSVCAQPQIQTPLGDKQARKSAPWVKTGIIYEIYPRAFSPEGTFAGIEKRLPELKQLGVTILWLMPIHPVGIERRKGTLGSSYSVRDYYGVNPEYGTLDDFKRLVESAHAQGLKIIIDLVANHTAWDSKILRQHPDWFTKDSSGAIVSPVADWSDVADLDYSKPALREYMIRMLEYWVRDVGIDGFRCDVSEMVPTDFWNEARAALDKIKPVFMLSEGQYPEHHLKAFDATYGWPLYHLLDLMIAGEKGPQDLDTLLMAEAKNYPKQSIRMRFSSNHDENAWDNPDVVKYGLEGAKMAAVLVSTFPGIPLLYNGQEAGSAAKLSLFEKVPIDWNAHPDFRDFYTKLFEVRKTNGALSTGSLIRLKGTDSTHIYSFMRAQGKERIAVVINLSPSAYATRFVVPGAKHQALRLTPLMTAPGLQTTIDGRAASVSLPGLGYGIFRVE